MVLEIVLAKPFPKQNHFQNHVFNWTKRSVDPKKKKKKKKKLTLLFLVIYSVDKNLIINKIVKLIGAIDYFS